MKQLVIGIVIIILFLFSCIKREQYSNIPYIEYIAMNHIPSETAFEITFSYRDGDGDYGQKEGDNVDRLRVTFFGYNNTTTKWTPLEINRKLLPYIENNFNIQKQGTVKVKLPYGFSIDSAYYKIHILDRAGNSSNTILTERKSIR